MKHKFTTGEMGYKFTTGEVVLTQTGRKTSPFPKIDLSTDRKGIYTAKRVDNWLIDNVIAEAKSRGDKYNLIQFKAINRKKMSMVDKDSAEMYLFGDHVAPVMPSMFLRRGLYQ